MTILDLSQTPQKVVEQIGKLHIASLRGPSDDVYRANRAFILLEALNEFYNDKQMYEFDAALTLLTNELVIVSDTYENNYHHIDKWWLNEDGCWQPCDRTCSTPYSGCLGTIHSLLLSTDDNEVRWGYLKLLIKLCQQGLAQSVYRVLMNQKSLGFKNNFQAFLFTSANYYMGSVGIDLLNQLVLSNVSVTNVYDLLFEPGHSPQRFLGSILDSGSDFVWQHLLIFTSNLLNAGLSLTKIRCFYNETWAVSRIAHRYNKNVKIFYLLAMSGILPDEQYKELAQYKEEICRYIIHYLDDLPISEKIKIVMLALDKDSRLGKVFWTKSRIFEFSPSLERGPLKELNEHLIKLKSREAYNKEISIPKGIKFFKDAEDYRQNSTIDADSSFQKGKEHFDESEIMAFEL